MCVEMGLEVQTNPGPVRQQYNILPVPRDYHSTHYSVPLRYSRQRKGLGH